MDGGLESRVCRLGPVHPNTAGWRRMKHANGRCHQTSNRRIAEEM